MCTQALRKCGLTVPLNPEKFIENDTNIEKVKTDTLDVYTFGQLKGVSIEEEGKMKMIMKKAEFLEL